MEIQEPRSNLQKILQAGIFAVTSELGPPKNAEVSVIKKKADLLRNGCDGFNITDNQTAIVRMSSIAAGSLCVNMGLEPIIQMTCRDRNRIAMQSDLLGAYALGIRDVLCLSGDHMRWGNHPEARKVYDLDSVNLIRMVRGMDAGKFQNGEDIKPSPKFFVGGVENPFAPPYEFRPYRLKKKIEAGAQFIQTQMIFNVERFKEFMKVVVDLGLHEQAYILAGVGPLKSPGMARYMRDSVAGMEVSPQWVERMEKTPKERYKDEGINVCVDIINEMRQIPGVAGVHIMSIEWEEAVPTIVERAGLMPRPKASELPVQAPAMVAAA